MDQKRVVILSASHRWDLWKQRYWQGKLFQGIDQPIEPKDPKLIEWERQNRERRQAEREETNRRQQARYQTWLRLKGRSCS
jgi:hypothetical protein